MDELDRRGGAQHARPVDAEKPRRLDSRNGRRRLPPASVA